MSVWGILFAPLAAAAMEEGEAFSPAEAAVIQDVAESVSGGGDGFGDAGDPLFAELAVMGDADMRAAAGGSHTAVDIGFIKVNNSENGAELNTVNVSNTTNGEIANNTIANNSGVTTVFNNTGNGVILQSNVNVNVFMHDPTN